MSYWRSRARCEFEYQLKSANNELNPLYKLAQMQSGGSRLLAAYYIFAYSQLEVYIGNLVEDSLNSVNNSSPTFEKWPDLTLGYLVHRSEKLAAEYRRFSFDGDETAILKKLAETVKKIVSWSSGAADLPAVDAADFLEKKKYPSPKNFPQLFRRLGIENIWAVIGEAGRINGEMILTSLNDLRTGITHEGKVPTGFTLGDYRDRLNQMVRLVAALDRGVSKHFCSKTITRKEWNSSMS